MRGPYEQDFELSMAVLHPAGILQEEMHRIASVSGGLRQTSLLHSDVQGMPDSLGREPFMMTIKPGAHLCWVCCDAGSAASAGARIAVWLASEMRLGHIDQVALAIEGPGVVGTHDVVVLQPALCTFPLVTSP